MRAVELYAEAVISSGRQYFRSNFHAIRCGGLSDDNLLAEIAETTGELPTCCSPPFYESSCCKTNLVCVPNEKAIPGVARMGYEPYRIYPIGNYYFMTDSGYPYALESAGTQPFNRSSVQTSQGFQ